MEVDETMQKNFLQFEPAPRRGEPEVCAPICLLSLGSQKNGRRPKQRLHAEFANGRLRTPVCCGM